MARSAAAMKLAARELGNIGWRAGESGMTASFATHGDSTKWIGGRRGPCELVLYGEQTYWFTEMIARLKCCLRSVLRSCRMQDSIYACDDAIDVLRRCLPVADADSHGATAVPGCSGEESFS